MSEDAPTPGPIEPSDETLTTEPLRRAIGERYLTYALSTIMHRALPDARDGLKPVHRRILYAMRELGLRPSAGFRKSAKISGDVMGNYHPHGDAAIYDAMARLAQDFNLRYPLVEGQGNFGSIDGDNPAAARYTEARLTPLAEALMEGLDENAVDLRPNYDGTLSEPVVLPAPVPHLLANGASGIAVGMATAIPPHNLDELIGACLHLLKHPDASDEALLVHMPGPDFPTGGVLVEPAESIAQAYRTGRGSFRLRARWSVEELGRGQRLIVVTEIPWQVQKSKLIEKLADIVAGKKLPALADVRDESAGDIRIVLEPRSRAVDPEQLMAMLFRLSDLEVRVPLNMNVLIDGLVPRVCSLREVLRAFLDHRREVLRRRSRHRLERIAQRLEVLGGLLIAFLNLDRVIDIIRYDDDPKAALQAEDWSRPRKRAASEASYVSPLPMRAGSGPGMTEAQAEAILNMRLRSLRRLEEMALLTERDALRAEQAGLEALLGSEDLQWKAIAADLRERRKAFGARSPGGARRTSIAKVEEVAEIAPDAMIEREPVTVALSEMGWIRTLKGHGQGADLRHRDGDRTRFLLDAYTTDRLLVLGANGRIYTLAVSALPGGRGLGEPLRLMIDLDAPVAALRVHRPGGRLVVATADGSGFVVAEEDVLAQTRAGRVVLNLGPEGRASHMVPVQGDHVAVVGQNRKMLVFPLDSLPVMARGKGVRLQSYKGGGLSDIVTLNLADGLAWVQDGGKIRREADLSEWTGKRGQAGRMAPRGFPRDNRFAPPPERP
ncbi:DNA topoisomerase IV subunit A [Rubellimicrobium sp. CFH 75288]|uniref:DNA topoisomerase IV subunit A n=1 Tax=Rubellimicrobium sp. CFH 75288 TaxID=2697034 RepID=UPI0014134A76|nr:DNA topoisomerase IV subunit A [Rubellimicrobium sp. CFH 75288]NAZ37923.1 DNA topoisomerase 4 subunit A [Rubellimicrobium sp. CFH 75288]